MRKIKYKTGREIALEMDIMKANALLVVLVNGIKAESDDYDGCGLPKDVLDGWIAMGEQVLATLDYIPLDEATFTYRE